MTSVIQQQCIVITPLRHNVNNTIHWFPKRVRIRLLFCNVSLKSERVEVNIESKRSQSICIISCLVLVYNNGDEKLKNPGGEKTGAEGKTDGGKVKRIFQRCYHKDFIRRVHGTVGLYFTSLCLHFCDNRRARNIASSV